MGAGRIHRTIRAGLGHLEAPVSIAPLAFFRVLFGAMMLAGTLRFAAKGWIHDLYVAPRVYFPYYGFGWLRPLGEAGMYAVFALMGLAALGMLLGWRYRLSAWAFFLSFTYVELLDKSNYLNHYYFVSLAAFLLACLPAHRAYSLDALRRPELRLDRIPRWHIGLLQLQLGVVYCYAGLAKIQPEWLLEAMPLRIWLPANSHLPLIGPWLGKAWVAYLFSWAGMLYDVLVPFLLLWGRTRPLAYAAVLAFHLLTGWLFPIGMFPYIMIGATLLFFPAALHERFFSEMRKLAGKMGIMRRIDRNHTNFAGPSRTLPSQAWALGLAGLFAAWQLLFPWRFLLYPGQVLWSEQGYRFSWRVMLTEKAGTAHFTVTDPDTGRRAQVTNSEWLRPQQEKMMAFQPDMVLQFAHLLRDHYRAQGIARPEVRADVRVSFNGRRSRPLVDPGRDLAAVDDGWGAWDWVLPMADGAPALVDKP